MGKVGLAFRVFWRTLRDQAIAERVERVLKDEKYPSIEELPTPAPAAPKKEVAKKPLRSDALNLLAALQREARLVDFIKEPITAYSDAQIGAAVRDVHRDCGAVLDRLFALQPLLSEGEGASIEVPTGFDATRYRLIGNVSGQPPYRGSLTHHGWEAAKCELPAWTGSEASAMIVAPAEVEIR